MSLMFLSVLFGMQLANEGILTIRGFDDVGYGSPFSVYTTEEEGMQASILGNDYSSHDLTWKKSELERIEAYNFFSATGKKLSQSITSAMKGAIEKGAQLFKNRKAEEEETEGGCP